MTGGLSFPFRAFVDNAQAQIRHMRLAKKNSTLPEVSRFKAIRSGLTSLRASLCYFSTIIPVSFSLVANRVRKERLVTTKVFIAGASYLGRELYGWITRIVQGQTSTCWAL